jgi:hypothetical protein
VKAPRRLFAALLLAASAGSARATHPFVSDDTNTQGRGGQQIELNTDRTQRSGDRSQVAAATYSYGLRDNLDIYLNLPAGLDSPAGFGNPSVGAKWRFLDQNGSSLALKPELLLPGGGESKGIGSGRTSMALALLATREAAPWTWLGTFGVAYNRYEDPAVAAANRSLLWRLSGGFAYHTAPALALVADFGVASNSDSSSRVHPAFALAGLIYSPSKNLDLDLGLKFGLNRAEVDRQLGAGLTLRF